MTNDQLTPGDQKVSDQIGEIAELAVLASHYTTEDIAAIKRLRNYYRRNFVNGESDENFQIWLEDGLRVLNGGMQG